MYVQRAAEMLGWFTWCLVRGFQKSDYVIRTQPCEGALSTVEAVAYALGHGEPAIRDLLLKPLQLLCRHQLRHGL